MGFGVATAGFQVEGGFNAKGEPANNWADWERDGRVEPSGPALRFWDRPDDLLDRVQALGCDRFRLSLEWARVQPGFDIAETAAPPYDETALDGYADVISACRRRGLEPLVTLHHFTHPRWAGVDLWGSAVKGALFDDYVHTAVVGLGDRLVARGELPLHDWATLNEINGLALAGGLVGAFPTGGRPGPARALRWLDHMLAAHCRAYDTIHDVYESRGWATPSVSTNNYVISAYCLDRLSVDLLLAREKDVAREELPAWLAEGEARHRAIMPSGPGRAASAYDAAIERLTRGLVTVDRLPFTLDAIYSSPRRRKLDFVALDWYDPVASHQLGLPGRRIGKERRWSPRRKLDEQVANPEAFRAALHGATWGTTGQPVVVLENGLCSLKSAAGPPSQRPDGLSRVDYLRAHLAQVRKAQDEGVPVAGYYHWTLADNYEWGSYTPRFGIHSVDRHGGGVHILEHDAMGDDAAAGFRQLIEEHREG